MSDLLAEIFIIFFEVLCCKIFYEIFGKVRYKGCINSIQLILLAGTIFGGARGLSDLFMVKQIVVVSTFAIFMFWHIKVNVQKSFMLAILYQAILLSIDYLAYSIMNELCPGNDMVIKQYSLGNVLVILLGKAILFFCVLIISKKLGGKSTEILADQEYLKFLFFPVFSIVIIVSMLSVFRYVETPEQAMLLLISAFGMVGMNIVVFYLIKDIMERETQLYENRIFQIKVKNQVEMYRSISENFDRQKKKTHEYKNQIGCIESLLGNKQYSKLEEYVKGICCRLDRELDAIDTNNVIVNAILNTKYQETEANGIVFVLRVNDLSKLQIDDEDIVTILSNLLNNAIEACKKCDRNRRILKLKIVNEDGMIKIGVRNTFNNPILYENGEIKSTKMLHIEEHGVGIGNIIEVIEKYDGSYIIEDCDQEFYFSIIIPN
ncbi:GHKL domain-containing protein [Petralouisia muris]|uniref:GHKL domain-containing protein n=1 Tax=Petralouisia muris TaxID=3032872 RepID=A0AC61RU93_9FIRM|nr:sensor histidine kinase [Petralouisia muris]TGY95329.1 GHKL domain-containing protein [Petralouisia muris]